MSNFEILYTAAGGLGLFFLGLKLLSEALQSSSGDLIHSVFSKLSRNRVAAVGAGIGITAVVQSSAISSVMTVSLVNAGLMEFRQAIGVILGANLGSTVMGWILALNPSHYGLLFISLGVYPMFVSRTAALAAFGKGLLALGLVFTALDFIASAFEPLRQSQLLLSYIHLIAADSVPTLLACVIVGCLLAVLIRNGAAMLGIILMLGATGVIEFNTAVALVIGANIGAAWTGQLAASGSSTAGIRAARANVIFNVFGAIVLILVFPFFTELVDQLVAGDPDLRAAAGGRPHMLWHIAMANTLFNLVNVLLCVPLLDYLVKLVVWLIPQQDEQEIHQLKYLDKQSSLAPEVALQQADLEMDNLVEITRQMFNLTRDYSTAAKADKECFDRINLLEDVTDTIEEEMITFVTRLLTDTVTQAQSARAYGLIRMADELESIADCLESFSIYRTRLFKQRESLSQEAWNDLMNFYTEVDTFVGRVVGARKKRADSTRITRLMDEGKRLGRMANSMRDRHLERLKNGTCLAIPAQSYSDMFVALRRIKNHAINILETYAN